MLTVQKFGGSSVADAGRIRRVAGIIAERAKESAVVAVLSARGDTTDILAADAAEISSSPPKRELDVLLSTGELGSVSLMAMQLERMGLDCISLSGRQAGIETDSNHGEAKIINIRTARLESELEKGRIVLVAGFQGINDRDDVTTLGRGGSDTTAVALAAALRADKCEIYSDVDGIYTADPRLVTGARKLTRIDYGDMLNLALGGSQVLHSRAVETAIRYRVPVYLLSSYVKTDGTLMYEFSERPPFCGVTRDKAENKISLVGRDADISALSEMAEVLGAAGIQPLSTSVGSGVCSVTVEAGKVLPALELIHRHFLG